MLSIVPNTLKQILTNPYNKPTLKKKKIPIYSWNSLSKLFLFLNNLL